jgi:hypothetical protein
MTMTNYQPLACSLGAGDLAQRLAAMAEVGADSLVAEERKGGRRLLRFRKSEEARRRLEGIVAAEGECCAFLDLSLSEEDDGLVLSIAAPTDAEAVADELAAAFSGRKA